MALQLGSQGKAWDQPGTFNKAHIISSFDPVPTERISLPEIPHTVQQLLQYSETVKRQPTKIIPMKTHIRSQDRQGQECTYLKGREYRD